MPNQKKLKGVRTKKVQPLPQTEYRPNNYVPVQPPPRTEKRINESAIFEVKAKSKVKKKY